MPVTKQYVRESNLIEGFNDPAIDDAALAAWQWFRDRLRIRGAAGTWYPLTHEIICELQKRITAHQPELSDMWRGTYRDRSRTRVTIAGREALPPEQVGRAMDAWLEQYYILTPKESHIRFEQIHPFIDGNGRTGRMLMWMREMQLGTEPTLIPHEFVDSYYNWFEQ